MSKKGTKPAAKSDAQKQPATPWRFPLRFAGLFLTGCALLTLFDATMAPPLNQATAVLLAKALGAIGQSALATGQNVAANGFMVQIIPECTAIYVLWLFACFVFTMPAPPLTKLAGLLLGIPALLAVNLVRLVAVVLVGQTAPEYFDLFHNILAQAVMVLAVVGAAMCWLELSRPGVLREPWRFPLRVAGLAVVGVLPWFFTHGLVAAFLDAFANFFAGFLGIVNAYTMRAADRLDPKTLNLLVYGALALATSAPNHWVRLVRFGKGAGVLCAALVADRVVWLATTGGESNHAIVAIAYFGTLLMGPVLVWLWFCKPELLRGPAFRSPPKTASVAAS